MHQTPLFYLSHYLLRSQALPLCLCLLFLVNCATTDRRARRDLSDTGVWTGKVMTTNPKTKMSQWANVSWTSDSDRQRMRVDVFAIMDIPIATFLKDGDEHHLWLFMEKKYYRSNDGRKLFYHLTKLPVEPAVFFELLGAMRINQTLGPSWHCGEKKGLHHCESKQLATQLSVDNHQADERIIKINKGANALRLRLSRAKVQFEDKVFRPLNTSQFKTITI
jgi:hypothetical protein